MPRNNFSLLLGWCSTQVKLVQILPEIGKNDHGGERNVNTKEMIQKYRDYS